MPELCTPEEEVFGDDRAPSLYSLCGKECLLRPSIRCVVPCFFLPSADWLSPVVQSPPRAIPRRQRSPSPIRPVVASSPTKAITSTDPPPSPGDYVLPPGGNFPVPPPVPLLGPKDDAPISEALLAWHAEILALERERMVLQDKITPLQHELTSSLASLDAVNRRRHAAWQSYLDLLGYQRIV